MSANKARSASVSSALPAWPRGYLPTGCDLRKSTATAPKSDQAIIKLGNGALKALGIKLDVYAARAFHVSGTLVVANHVSIGWIFSHLSALYPSSFIAKQEISRWPVLGKMGRNAGTVFYQPQLAQRHRAD